MLTEGDTPGPGQYRLRPFVGQYANVLTENNLDVLYV